MRALFTWAAASYLTNVALGTLVQTRRVDTGNARWVHHALYISTASLTTGAASSLVWSRSRAAWWILPAIVPLGILPYAARRGRRHVTTALAAGPFVIAGAIAAWREQHGVSRCRPQTKDHQRSLPARPGR